MAYKNAINNENTTPISVAEPIVEEKNFGVIVPENMYFGVDTSFPANTLLQNNITLFDWVERNKPQPNFWGRNIFGANCITKDEIHFLHNRGCRVALIYQPISPKETEEDGRLSAQEIFDHIFKLGMHKDIAVFLEIQDIEAVTNSYMLGFAKELLNLNLIPGFKANTDAQFTFDRKFSRCLNNYRDVFEKCIVWATAPNLDEYYRTTNAHLIHPDVWIPFAPSGISKNDICIWQYGKECHPIYDEINREITFNVNLTKETNTIFKYMI